MVRTVALPLLLSLALAPYQCAREPDAAMRREETPGEALYGLAESFREKGDERAWRATLEYLVARYPSSRFAATAQAELAGTEEEEAAGSTTAEP